MDRPPPPRPALVVHGGAWAIPDDEWKAHREGVERAVVAGWKVLLDNGSALDAIVAAITILEDDPTYDAGVGSVLTREGHVEMDAGLFDGRGLDVGAVACVRDVRNPILAARAVLRSDHVLLCGEGASAFARANGVATCDPNDLVVPRERARLERLLEAERARTVDPREAFGRPVEDRPTGTVGAVAIDRGGNIAAGGSTGGTPGKLSGRIGDTPIPGAGLYADNRFGAAACTGWGEGILRMGLARNAVSHLRDSAAQDAAWLAVREMDDRIQGKGGVIVLSRDGSLGFAFNTPRMAVGYMDEEIAEPWIIGNGAR
jgi:L-asparaginase / beta-aspartyl-peptidase